jgi:hypothetical protein
MLRDRFVPAALLVTLLAASVPAAGAPSRYSDVPPGQQPDGQPAPELPLDPLGSLTFYTDRGAFQAANPGLPLEDFGDNNVPPGGVAQCTDLPTDSTTNDACFLPGQILPGVAYFPSDATANALLEVGFAGNQCAALGPDQFAANMEIDFAPAVRALGFDYSCGFAATEGGVDMMIEVFGPGGSLGSTSVPCAFLPSFSFFGVDTSDPGGITQIVTTIAGSFGDLTCNIEFGGVPVPVELMSFDVE